MYHPILDCSPHCSFLVIIFLQFLDNSLTRSKIGAYLPFKPVAPDLTQVEAIVKESKEADELNKRLAELVAKDCREMSSASFLGDVPETVSQNGSTFLQPNCFHNRAGPQTPKCKKCYGTNFFTVFIHMNDLEMVCNHEKID